jgi:hypothetical protein
MRPPTFSTASAANGSTRCGGILFGGKFGLQVVAAYKNYLYNINPVKRELLLKNSLRQIREVFLPAYPC